MSEKLQRTESLQPLHELATGLAQEIGEQAQQRLDWLMQQTGESFGSILMLINSTARGINIEDHDFDGERIQAGRVGASIPPDQEDKIMLLDELVYVTQQSISEQSEKGEDPQTIMSELAVAIPTVVNKLHLFADGNGRTSRILRMVLRDGDQITPDKIDALVNKTSYEKYDATPGDPLEISVTKYMRQMNDTSDISVRDDIAAEDELLEEVSEDIMQIFPNIDPKVINAYSDGSNFYETVRLIGKNKGLGSVSLLRLFGQITDSPEELVNFTNVYRGVRKQRVEVLIGGLTGETPVPLVVNDNERAIRNYINNARKTMKLPLIDPDLIDTIQDFQIAYCETFAPQRIVA